MKSICFLLAIFAVALSMISCGGSGTDAPSPFQGSFSGNWISDGPDVGTAQIVVSPGGHFGGSETDTTISLQGAVSGHITNQGTFTGTITPTGGSAISATGTFNISGDSNTLSGSVLSNGVTYTYTLSRV